MSKPHLLLLITEDWYFWSHRRAIATAALKAGFRVTLASRFGELRQKIEAAGVETVPIRLRRGGRNPVGEAAAVGDLVRHYRELRPDLVHHVAIKPVLYGSWAARVAGVTGVVNAISGLGYAFTGSGRSARYYRAIAGIAYRSVLGRQGTYTVFQNSEDRAYFVDRGWLREEQAVLIRGSGVDLNVFKPRPEASGEPVILYAGRILWSKGIGDLVAASALLRGRGHGFRMVFIGHSDTDNPEAIPPGQLRAWEAEGLIEWWGRRNDVAEIMAAAHVVALPSEREGIPKVLLEAAGAGKPLVTTDTAGCRDVVEDGKNGLLVPVHDPEALASALGHLIRDPELRARMGAAARAKAESEFAEEHVVEQTLALYSRALRRGT